MSLDEAIAADPFGIHEALHTAHVLLDCYSAHVAEHPAVEKRPEIAALADKAAMISGARAHLAGGRSSMPRNPYARSLRVKPQRIIPDKREKTYRQHLDDTLREPIPPDFEELLKELR